MAKVTGRVVLGLLVVIASACSRPAGDVAWSSRISPDGSFMVSVPERFVLLSGDRSEALAQLKDELGSSFDSAIDDYSETEVPPGALLCLDRLSSVPAIMNSLLVMQGDPRTFSPPVDMVIRSLESAGYRNVQAWTIESGNRTILFAQYELDYSSNGVTIPIVTSHATFTLGQRSFTVDLASSMPDAANLRGVAERVAESIQERFVP